MGSGGERAGRGGNFFALDPEVWERLWTVPTVNRMNLALAFLVLLAGTGSDHRLSKWSAKACEDHLGIGKPRAKHAIEELIAAGLAERTEASTRLKPQYRLPPLPREAEPVFLPVALVTGLAGREAPVLRRVRETGDPLVLRMLVDLYGRVQADAAGGVPPAELCERAPDASPPRKVLECGAHALWALPLDLEVKASGWWCAPHRVEARTEAEAWAPFWERVGVLKAVGALWFEPWVFDGTAPDAEPLMPVDLGVLHSGFGDDETARLTRALGRAAAELAGGREGRLDRHGDALLLPRLRHQRPPAVVGVARLRVEADTPGRRLAYAKRMDLVERAGAACDQLLRDAAGGRFDRPPSRVTVRDRA